MGLGVFFVQFFEKMLEKSQQVLWNVLKYKWFWKKNMKKVGKDETPFIEKTKTPIAIIGNLD